jgi:hypothetical protein
VVLEDFQSYFPFTQFKSELLFALQWMLQIPGATSYMGCIGKDKFGELMKKNSKLAGVNVSFFNFRMLILESWTIEW